MPEDMQISPLLDGLMVGEPITDQAGVRCCPAMEAETEDKYIIKILTVPASQVQVDALLLTGVCADAEAAEAYFRRSVEALEQEAQLLQQLSRLEGFVSFDGWQAEPLTEGIGYTLYIKSAYRPTLERYLSRSSMTQGEAMEFAMDLCAALTVARQSGYEYVALKPGNIYRSARGSWCIGDLGFVALEALSYTSLPEKYRSSYTAPEVTDAYAALSDTMDIYALGLILYQIYNNGQLPAADEGQPMAAPAYADYALAQIILSACDPDPAQRWQTPAELGQALAAYRQEYAVEDAPIIPPPPIPEEPEELPEEEPIPQEEILETPEAEAAPPEETDGEALLDAELEALAFDQADETQPSEENTQALEDTPLTEEVNEMLAQADDLIAHETPDPVIPPDPIDVPIPPPITDEAEEAPAPQEPEPAEEALPEEEAEEAEEDAVQPELPSSPEDAETEPAPAAKPKRLRGAVIWLCAALTILALMVGGWFFYKNYYLQTVASISLSGDDDYLSVTLHTEIDNQLLTVVCTDTYGNTLRAAPVENVAHFQDLSPDTQYKISVEISGFHGLTGNLTDSYTTPSRTEIVSFNAVTGSESGSAILSFAVHGPEDTAWRIRYSTADEEELSREFNGHMLTVTGLTVGKCYTFTLEPVADIYVVGTCSLEHTASDLVYGENLTVNRFLGGMLQATWSAPQGVSVSSWNVRCYNEAGFDKSFSVTEGSIAIEGLDTANAYTLDVYAEGMTVAASTSISANSVTVTDLTLDTSQPGSLTLSWTFEAAGEAPSWLLLYTVDGGSAQVIQCADASAVLPVLIPGGKYAFSLQCAAGNTVFNGSAEFTAPGGETFSGYNVSAENLQFKMCRIPNWDGWSRHNIKDEDYTTTFAVSQRAGFVIQLTKDYTFSRDKIQVLFVIKDSAGSPVSLETTTVQWAAICSGGYGTLSIPVMPTTAGSYTMHIYFNSAFVCSQSFQIQ